MSYDKVIPPGEEGKIKVKVVTKGYGGNKYAKSIRVDTNDPKHASIELKITGEVKTFATIIPKSVFLSGEVGEELSQTVQIIPETDQPFNILKISALSGSDIRQELKETEKSGKKIYELTIENTKTTEGRYFDTITIITDKSDQTVLTIHVRGNIKPQSDTQPEGSENNEPQGHPESIMPVPEVKEK